MAGGPGRALLESPSQRASAIRVFTVAMTVMATDHRRENRRPILVTGMHRSGTSWLGLMLCASGALINVGEPLKPSNRRTIFESKIPYWYNYNTEANEGNFLGFYKDAIAFHPHPTHDLTIALAARRISARVASGKLRTGPRPARLLISDPSPSSQSNGLCAALMLTSS